MFSVTMVGGGGVKITCSNPTGGYTYHYNLVFCGMVLMIDADYFVLHPNGFMAGKIVILHRLKMTEL